MRKISHRLVAGIAGLLFAISAAGLAAEAPQEVKSEAPNPLSDRPEDLPAALHYLQDNHVKLTYIGNDGGLKGYLGESEGGKFQTFYLAPDGNHVVAGVLFRAGGVIVTGVQIGEMQKRYDAAKKAFGDSSIDGNQPGKGDTAQPAQATAPAAKANTAAAPHASQPAAPPAPSAPPQASPIGQAANPAADASTLKPNDAVAAPKPQASLSPLSPLPDAGTNDVSHPNDPASAKPWLSSYDKDDFLGKMNDVAWFTVGESTAPALYMVVDPHCPFCHAAWQHLKPLVVNGKLQIKIIMIAALPGSDVDAISLLSRKQPGAAWFTGEGSEDGTPVQPPPAASTKEYTDARNFLDINWKFAHDYLRIKGTPFVAYVGRDSKLYSTEGVQDFDSFLAAL